jgi:hypothetical protein
MIILIRDQVINPYFEISLESSGKNETGPSMFSKSGNSLHDLPSSLRVELATRVKSSAPFHSVDEALYVVANSSMHFFKNKLPKKKTHKTPPLSAHKILRQMAEISLANNSIPSTNRKDKKYPYVHTLFIWNSSKRLHKIRGRQSPKDIGMTILNSNEKARTLLHRM